MGFANLHLSSTAGQCGCCETPTAYCAVCGPVQAKDLSLTWDVGQACRSSAYSNPPGNLQWTSETTALAYIGRLSSSTYIDQVGSVPPPGHLWQSGDLHFDWEESWGNFVGNPGWMCQNPIYYQYRFICQGNYNVLQWRYGRNPGDYSQSGAWFSTAVSWSSYSCNPLFLHLNRYVRTNQYYQQVLINPEYTITQP